MSVGLPVITANRDVLAAQVFLNKTGATLNLHDSKSLLLALDTTCTEREPRSERCLEVYASGYTASICVDGIQQVYESIRA